MNLVSENKINVIGSIIQIIPWEKRNDYMVSDSFSDLETPCDMIVLSTKNEHSKSKWQTYKDSWKTTMQPLNESILNSYPTIWMRRPHDYKENDIVELEITLKKLASLK